MLRWRSKALEEFSGVKAVLVFLENGDWLGATRACPSLTWYVITVSCCSARVLFAGLCPCSGSGPPSAAIANGNSYLLLYDGKLLPTDNNEDAPLSGRESGPWEGGRYELVLGDGKLVISRVRLTTGGRSSGGSVD